MSSNSVSLSPSPENSKQSSSILLDEDDTTSYHSPPSSRKPREWRKPARMIMVERIEQEERRAERAKLERDRKSLIHSKKEEDKQLKMSIPRNDEVVYLGEHEYERQTQNYYPAYHPGPDPYQPMNSGYRPAPAAGYQPTPEYTNGYPQTYNPEVRQDHYQERPDYYPPHYSGWQGQEQYDHHSWGVYHNQAQQSHQNHQNQYPSYNPTYNPASAESNPYSLPPIL